MFDTCSLTKNDVERYGRQLIMSPFGVKGQLDLKKAKVLIVGCGGLGCPSAIYLAGAGVGTVGLVDDDVVDESNLHRQVCHTESRIGILKVTSLATSLKMLNSNVNVVEFPKQLNPNNAIKIINDFDIVLDCTDNVVTRYLVNDCCVILKKPLVSASALGFEGQLTVYNYKESPCYRCLFPKPPPANTVKNCSDGGVLGPVPGMLGTMQATEAIKILTNIGTSIAGRLFLYDAEEATTRTIKLRSRNPKCEVCGDAPTITEPMDYEAFCQMPMDDKCKNIQLLERCDRISVEEYKHILESQQPHLLLDVRPKAQVDICRFKHSLDIEYDEMEKDGDVMKTILDAIRNIKQANNLSSSDPLEVLILCRRGNHSQLAVDIMRNHPIFANENLRLRDVIGGLRDWARRLESNLAVY